MIKAPGDICQNYRYIIFMFRIIFLPLCSNVSWMSINPFGKVVNEVSSDHVLIESLYRRYYQQLYVYANAFLEDSEEARDVVNDVFASVWQKRKADGYDEKSFSVYAYKLVRSRCLDLIRHKQVEKRYRQLTQVSDFIHNDDDVRDFEQRIERLRQAVEELPEPGRSIIKTCYYKKLTYQQTADELQMSIHTVHKTMTKMYASLRKMLKNDK